MKIDIERLEDVLSGKRRGRDCGSTFAMLTVVANSVYFCADKTLGIVFAHRMALLHDSWLLLNIVKEIFGDELTIKNHVRGDFVEFNNGCKVRFINKNSPVKMKGEKFDNIYVDPFIETLPAEERTLLDTQILTKLK